MTMHFFFPFFLKCVCDFSVTHKELDFMHLLQHLRRVLRGQSSLWSSQSLARTFPPMVLDYQIDAKKELEKNLKLTCDQFIMLVTNAEQSSQSCTAGSVGNCSHKVSWKQFYNFIGRSQIQSYITWEIKLTYHILSTSRGGQSNHFSRQNGTLHSLSL